MAWDPVKPFKCQCPKNYFGELCEKRECIDYAPRLKLCLFYRVYQKNGVHVLCLIISKLLKLMEQFWTCFKPRSFLFRTSRNSYFYSA